jgi:hypothetical protein
MKLKIVSDGTAENTHIINAETEEELENVINLEVSMDAFNIEAAFLVRNPELSLTNIDAQEVQVGDNTIQYDGGTSTSDDQ